MRSKFAALLLAVLLLASPALAATSYTIQASGAQTANGTGSSVDAVNCVGKNSVASVNITAGSGTVAAFKVSLQTTIDGTNWITIACPLVVSSGGTATANTQFLENETAVQTSGTGGGVCFIPAQSVRAQWVITAGASPSETFAVVLSCN